MGVPKCTSDNVRLCQNVNGDLCSEVSSIVSLEKQYEVIYEAIVYLKRGFSVIPAGVNASSATFEMRNTDITAVALPGMFAAEVMNTKNSSALAYSFDGILKIGDILQTDNQRTIQTVHYRFAVSHVYVRPSITTLILNYPIGRWQKQTLTLRNALGLSDVQFSLISTLPVANVSLVVPSLVVATEAFNVTILPHPGYNITYSFKTVNSSEKHSAIFFQSGFARRERLFPFVFREIGQTTLLVSADNSLGSVARLCQLVVMERIKVVNMSKIVPVVFGNQSEIMWIITEGSHVFINISFGDGTTFQHGPFNIKDFLVSLNLHNYTQEGAHEVTIIAYNLVSNFTVNSTAFVETPVNHLDCKEIHSNRDIEVNENIKLFAEFSQGTNAQFLADYGDNSSTANPTIDTFMNSLKNTEVNVHHGYSTWGFFDFSITIFNHVSKANCVRNIQVHKPVFPLTGFAINCPARNLSDVTSCTLNITGGNDFTCDWDFGDSSQMRAQFMKFHAKRLYGAVGAYPVSINCSNRLFSTAASTVATVQKPVTSLTATIPWSQALNENFNASFYVIQGTNVSYKITIERLVLGVKKSIPITHLSPDTHSARALVDTSFFSAIGAYRLKVMAENMVSPPQVREHVVNVQARINNVRLSSSHIYIPLGNMAAFQAQVDSGSNITLSWDFKDGHTKSFKFDGYSLGDKGQALSHVYNKTGSYHLTVTASNLLGSQAASLYIHVLTPAANISVTSDGPKELPPGTITFQLSVQQNTRPPTNATVDVDFSDGNTLSNHSHNGLSSFAITHSYANPGIYEVKMTVRNPISRLELVPTIVVVQRSVKNLKALTYHTGGDAVESAPGKGSANDLFPQEHPVRFVANITDGTSVTYTWNFGDGTPEVVTQKISVEHTFRETKRYEVSLVAENYVSKQEEFVSVRMLQSILNVTFVNDGPTLYRENTTFTIVIGQKGTESCFLVDVGNNTRFLYKNDESVDCADELEMTQSVTALLSDTNFNISITRTGTESFPVQLIAVNPVSRVEINDFSVVVMLPCRFPIVRIPGISKNFERPLSYYRAQYIAINSRCTVNCLASRATTFKWDIIKVKSATDTGSITGSPPESVIDLPSLIIQRQSLDYGMYKVRLNVSLVGLTLVSRVAEGYLKIKPSPLNIEIMGGNAWTHSVNTTVTLNASHTHDPDFAGAESRAGLRYYWFCTREGENYEVPVNVTIEPVANGTNAGGCLGTGPGRLDFHSDILQLPAGTLQAENTYIFWLYVVKGSRNNSFRVALQIVENKPPEVRIR